MKPEGQTSPMGYLTAALDHIQAHALFRERVDWVAVRERALSMAADARTTADTYPAIRYALGQLGDRHSNLAEPEDLALSRSGRRKGAGYVTARNSVALVAPNSPAEQAGLRLGDTIIASSSDEHGLHLTVRCEHQAETVELLIVPAVFDYVPTPCGRWLEGHVGYLELPGLAGSPEILVRYANTCQQLIRDIDRQAVSGWVLDLRRNTGGNMWPMLAGVGPLLGQGAVGAFVAASGESTAWSYRDGKAFVGDVEVAGISGPEYRLNSPEPPVAVLTSDVTCSSGEAVVIAFRGRAHTRTFGERTSGLSTANDTIQLSDGALLALTVAYEADRTGQVYPQGIQPDEHVAIDWARFGTDDDPALAAAGLWLRNYARDK